MFEKNMNILFPVTSWALTFARREHAEHNITKIKGLPVLRGRVFIVQTLMLLI